MAEIVHDVWKCECTECDQHWADKSAELQDLADEADRQWMNYEPEPWE